MSWWRHLLGSCTDWSQCPSCCPQWWSCQAEVSDPGHGCSWHPENENEQLCLNQRKWCLVVFHSNELLSLWAITGIITPESREQLLKAWHNMVSWELQIYNHCFWNIYLYTFSSPRSHSILRVCPDCLISRQHSSWVMLNTGRPFTWTKKLNKTNSGILWIYLLKSSSPFCKGQPWRQESFF